MAYESTKVIKQIQINNQDLYDINALYIQDTEGNGKTWSDITSLVTQAFEIKVYTTLPEASAETQKIMALVQETGAESGTYVEYVTVKSGEGTSATYSWERIGTTKADLSDYAYKDKATPVDTSETAAGATGEAGAAVTGTVTGNYDKASSITAAGGVTIDGSNFSAALAETNISTSGKYEKATSVTGSTTVADHSHSVTFASTSITYVTGVENDDKVTVVTGITGGTASGSTDVIPSYTYDDPTFASVSAITAVGTIDKEAAHTHTVDSHEHAADVTVVTGITGFSGGVIDETTFNTDAIKDASITTATTTSDGAAQYIESISAPSVTLGGNSSPMKTATVNNCVLSWTTEAVTAEASGAEATTKYMSISTTAATAKKVDFTAATFSLTTNSAAGAAAAKTLTAAAAGAHAHTISGTSSTNVLEKISAAGKITAAEAVSVVTGVTAAAVATTTSVLKSLKTATFDNVTSATLDAKGGFTINGSAFGVGTTETDITLTGTLASATLAISGTQVIADHTHGINTTPTALSLTTDLTAAAHTHSIAGHKHTVASHEHPAPSENA